MNDLVRKIKNQLSSEVKPSLGCTEIVAVGLATAYARGNQKPPYHVSLILDYDTFRNAASVGVPGGGIGIKDGVYRGLLGDPAKGLNVFNNPPSKTSEIEISELEIRAIDVPFLFVYARVNERCAAIAYYHDNVFYSGKRVDHEDLIDQIIENTTQDTASSHKRESTDMELIEIFNNLESLLEDPEILAIIKKGVKTNMDLYKNGESTSKYMKKTFGGLKKDGPLTLMKYQTGVAVEARMRGAPYPAMSVAGSGNQGILTTIPLITLSEKQGLATTEAYKAILLSWCVTIYTTKFMGRLSPFCGLFSKAGVGLTAGIAYLRSGMWDTIESSMLNYIAMTFGTFCDGAKPSCSLKAIQSIQSAYDATTMAIEGERVSAKEGFIGENIQQTLRNIGKIKENINTNYRKAYIEILSEKVSS